MVLASLEDLTCNICIKDFVSYSALEQHSRQIHKVCICIYISIYKYLLSKIYFCYKEEPISCEECGKELLNKYALQGHMQSHQNETCKVCHETMKKKTLYKHMETHKENRTKYECEQCHLSYTRKDSLLRHVRSHS